MTSLSAAYQIREQLLQQIQIGIDGFNNDMQNHRRISSKKIQEILQNLEAFRDTNNNLSNQRVTHLDKKGYSSCCNEGSVSPAVYLMIGLQILVWGAVTAPQVYNYATTNTTQEDTTGNSGSDLFTLIATITGLLVTGVVNFAYTEISGERDNYRLLTEISQIKEQGTQELQIFMETLNDFKREQKAVSKKISRNEKISKKEHSRQEKLLAECLQRLDQIPTEEARPLRNTTVMTLLGMLQEDHPIVQTVNHIAERHFSSTSSSNSNENTFAGEQMAFTNLTSHTRRLLEKKDSVLTTDDCWNDLERRLGVTLPFLPSGNVCINRYGAIVEEIDPLSEESSIAMSSEGSSS